VLQRYLHPRHAGVVPQLLIKWAVQPPQWLGNVGLDFDSIATWSHLHHHKLCCNKDVFCNICPKRWQ
jgi:hypothetical protein